MRQAHGNISLRTKHRGLHPITPALAEWLRGERARDGMLTVFLPHTSASLLLQENADPDVARDLEAFFERLVKDGDPLFRHRDEGPDDMSAHVRAALTQSHLCIPVRGGQLALGTWQGAFLFEHRTAPHERRLTLHFVGE